MTIKETANISANGPVVMAGTVETLERMLVQFVTRESRLSSYTLAPFYLTVKVEATFSNNIFLTTRNPIKIFQSKHRGR